mmetsp:Transcript_59261/g.191565  ORF Transcript_59261/g.191565 Transcript_59261/m.191565 type:complete len:799 (+) Transcript_59261:46-2442(+)
MATLTSKPQLYLVDNSTLQSPAHGLGYRLSKLLEDKDGQEMAFWGSVVTGVCDGDGWVRVGTRYLPSELQGATVITPRPEDSIRGALELRSQPERQSSPALAAPVLNFSTALSSPHLTSPKLLQEYRVDNSHFRSQAHGLGYRRSKRLEDKDGNALAMWGTTVSGADEGDGWVRVGDRFLPWELHGNLVLVFLRYASASDVALSLGGKVQVPQLAHSIPKRCFQVLVSNMPDGTSVPEVRQLFEAQHCSDVIELTADGRWFQALVSFPDAASAQQAVHSVHGRLLRNRTLHVGLAKLGDPWRSNTQPARTISQRMQHIVGGSGGSGATPMACEGVITERIYIDEVDLSFRAEMWHMREDGSATDLELFVSGLPASLREGGIRDHMQGLGIENVREVFLLRCGAEPKGMAYVTFQSHEAAVAAKQLLQISPSALGSAASDSGTPTLLVRFSESERWAKGVRGAYGCDMAQALLTDHGNSILVFRAEAGLSDAAFVGPGFKASTVRSWSGVEDSRVHLLLTYSRSDGEAASKIARARDLFGELMEKVHVKVAGRICETGSFMAFEVADDDADGSGSDTHGEGDHGSDTEKAVGRVAVCVVSKRWGDELPAGMLGGEYCAIGDNCGRPVYQKVVADGLTSEACYLFHSAPIDDDAGERGTWCFGVSLDPTKALAWSFCDSALPPDRGWRFSDELRRSDKDVADGADLVVHLSQQPSATIDGRLRRKGRRREHRRHKHRDIHRARGDQHRSCRHHGASEASGVFATRASSWHPKEGQHSSNGIPPARPSKAARLSMPKESRT